MFDVFLMMIVSCFLLRSSAFFAASGEGTRHLGDGGAVHGERGRVVAFRCVLVDMYTEAIQ